MWKKVLQTMQLAAQSSAERVQLFTEITRVYGYYFVIIEQCRHKHNLMKQLQLVKVNIYL